MTEERLRELEALGDPVVRELVAALREAPTLEQLHSLVGQLKEVRGENSKLREELHRLQKAQRG